MELNIFIVFVIAGKASFDTVVIEKPPCLSGILSSYERNLTEGAQRTDGYVLQVAYGRGYNIKSGHCLSSFSDFNSVI